MAVGELRRSEPRHGLWLSGPVTLEQRGDGLESRADPTSPSLVPMEREEEGQGSRSYACVASCDCISVSMYMCLCSYEDVCLDVTVSMCTCGCVPVHASPYACTSLGVVVCTRICVFSLLPN